MNQARLTEAVVARLERAAAADPLAWVPAVGVARPDGTSYGLGVEIFGARPTRAQLELLARVLFRLGTRGRIEVRDFKPNRKSGKLGPAHGSDQTVYFLAGVISQPLRQDAERQYGVRLTAE